MNFTKRSMLLVGLLLIFGAGLGYAQDDDIPGKIAFIGIDNNIYVWDGLDEDIIQLTDDADRTQSSLRRYQMPTWSTDGRLAYFANDINEDSYTTNVFVSADGTSEGEQIYQGENEVLNYAAWSPANCTSSDACRELALLFNSRLTGGLFVTLLQDEVVDTPSEVIGRGGPFYFSWSADGENMIWQRNNTRLDVFNVAEREVAQRLPYRPGVFQAPDWSPVDNQLLFGRMSEQRGRTDLIVVEGEEERVIAESLDGLVYFAWSPDARYVAYTMRNDALFVLDAETGEIVTQTIVESIGPFFWSPDSNRIAFVTLATPEGTFTTKVAGLARPAPQPDLPDLAWSIVEVDTGESRRYSAFIPTSEMVYLFTYFDQFAKSHSLWSPDGRYLVYSEVNDDNEAVVSILDTDVQDTFPLAIAEGTMAVWSFNE